MDVSRVDPEEVLVDAQNVEPGDVSGDIDEAWLTGKDHGSEDKVLVSVRYVISSWLDVAFYAFNLYTTFIYLTYSLSHIESVPPIQRAHGKKLVKPSNSSRIFPNP
jgi:hypothetical protein